MIIGNPPYVEYRKVVSSYRLVPGQYTSEDCGNLYGFCMERSGALLGANGSFGMIVPAGLLGLGDTASLRTVLLDRFDLNWFSTYAIRPAKLFEGVDQRLCICLEWTRSDGQAAPTIWTTAYRHWNTEERENLFPTVTYNLSGVHSRLKRVAQTGSVLAASILGKLEIHGAHPVGLLLSSGRTGSLLHYHRSPRYWIRAMDFEQYFKSPTRDRSVHHFRDLYFSDEQHARFVGAALNSTLFFFWFVTLGNGRNVTGEDVELFPIGRPARRALEQVGDVFGRLMKDYKENSFVRYRSDCEFQEFRPALSKSLFDEIDRLLATHYSFTEEEVDFLINYDLKYRLGRDSEEEAEE